jgi:hypothetical protein
MNSVDIKSICDEIVEACQTKWMLEDELTDHIEMDISSYLINTFYSQDIEQEIIKELSSKMIRLYEDISDLDGYIIESKEVEVFLYESVSIHQVNDQINLDLKFHKDMIKLMT